MGKDPEFSDTLDHALEEAFNMERRFWHFWKQALAGKFLPGHTQTEAPLQPHEVTRRRFGPGSDL